MQSTTCSKWPELRITRQDKRPYTCCVDRELTKDVEVRQSGTPETYCELFSVVRCQCVLLLHVTLHLDRFRWSPKILAQGLFCIYLYLPMLYESRVLSELHSKVIKSVAVTLRRGPRRSTPARETACASLWCVRPIRMKFSGATLDLYSWFLQICRPKRLPGGRWESILV